MTALEWFLFVASIFAWTLCVKIWRVWEDQTERQRMLDHEAFQRTIGDPPKPQLVTRKKRITEAELVRHK